MLVADARRPSRLPLLALLRTGVAVPATVALLLRLARDPGGLARPAALAWVAILLAAEALPVRPWGGPGLSVAMLYPPPLAGAIAFLGALDPRRIYARPLAAWGRCGVAWATVTAGGAVFHATAAVPDPARRLLPGFAAACLLMWLAQAAAGAAEASLETGRPVRQVLARMNAVSPYRFPATFPGMGWFGLPIAVLYPVEGFWPAVLLLGLLLYARTVCLKAWRQRGQLADLLERERQVTARLQELNRSRGQFVAVASHEVRTPLTAILGYVATLRRRRVDDPAMREQFLEIIDRQGKRLLGLVETLLTAAKLEEGRLATRLDRVAVEELCQEVVEGLGPQRGRVRLEVPADLPPVLTDRRYLGQVLANLLDNAVKYSPSQAPCELGARVDGSDVTMWVRDHGIGIERDELDRIFERFYQVDGSDSRPAAGIGLGLHLVRELVALLGGTVAVDTWPGLGSRFTVRLPVRHPGAQARRSSTVPSPATRKAAGTTATW
jgi:signal transduction histidine kinase